jgi:hypothetical protein
MSVRPLAAAPVAMLALALSGAAWASGGSGAIAASGKIGPLQIDKSVRADVIAFAGKPEVERSERVLGFAHYDALGYGCSTTEAPDNFPVGNSGPYCRTVFFIDVPHHTLEDFVTTSTAYHEIHGVRIGTSTADAQRLLRTRVSRNCLVVLHVDTSTALLRINFTAGRADTLVLHSLKRTAGLFQCTA